MAGMAFCDVLQVTNSIPSRRLDTGRGGGSHGGVSPKGKGITSELSRLSCRPIPQCRNWRQQIAGRVCHTLGFAISASLAGFFLIAGKTFNRFKRTFCGESNSRFLRLWFFYLSIGRLSSATTNRRTRKKRLEAEPPSREWVVCTSNTGQRPDRKGSILDSP